MGKFEQHDATVNVQNGSNTWSALHDDAYSLVQYKGDNAAPLKSQSQLLSEEYIDKMLHKNAKQRHQDDLKRYDKDLNGKLDDRELDHAIKNAESLEDLIVYSVLKNYDKNRDGIIDAKEQKKRDEDIEKARKEDLKKYDTNGDGKLDDKEQAKRLDDFFKDKRPPVSDKEFKEQVAESIHDLRYGIAFNDLKAIVRDIERAAEMMPREQYAKYMKAVNDELRKFNPTMEIGGASSNNGKHTLAISIPSTGGLMLVGSSEARKITGTTI